MKSFAIVDDVHANSPMKNNSTGDTRPSHRSFSSRFSAKNRWKTGPLGPGKEYLKIRALALVASRTSVWFGKDASDSSLHSGIRLLRRMPKKPELQEYFQKGFLSGIPAYHSHSQRR
jgi:hypothetical protein